MGYKYEFTWLLRLPVDELPDKPGEKQEADNQLLLWKRTSGNIILGFFRTGHKLVYPVGMDVLLVTRSGEVIGIGTIVKSEIYQLPDNSLTTVVEFSVKRMFEEEEKRILTRVVKEMYG
ncbi:hypothetical protein [Calderihabitans maritimus]|uniref:Uncharacterized protein n=1 Tax=Calderihabitans maritimus TaxID=1246530 RepID=A0A1Z5HP76_9FIRM|nr:hypothetical protein [Calderihabitans maritimus]GAW91238.1 hypothetical protein Moth_0509 [Calderihabitans maritimus]